ncbi:hypothetical protein DIPPA_08706 [Diplonema papillatum]|nr:hypothetical protein DIPPA_08706 [Diplonema papillatum]
MLSWAREVVFWARLVVFSAFALLGSFAVRQPEKKGKGSGRTKVAVIGGGIAGTSVAWALRILPDADADAAAAAVDVTLFESRDVLGGNAKTQSWPRTGLRTGVSVLAWPEAYFKNYEALLKRLRVPTAAARPRFVVSLDGQTPSWAHGAPGLNTAWHPDMARWDLAVAFIRSVNGFFACTLPAALRRCTPSFLHGVLPGGVPEGKAGRVPSFYEVSYLNPLNLVPARVVMRAFGVSQAFWNCVAVPVYSSSFLTGTLRDVPACILPALDDIISVGQRAPGELRTWAGHSGGVFDAMAAAIGEQRIRLASQIAAVEVAGGGQRVRFADGSCEYFDYVIFACPANSVNDLTKACRKTRSPLFDLVVDNVRYETERDRNFVHGDVHTDRNVLPAGAVRDLVLSEGFSNYVRVLNREKGLCSNVFCLGTWVPAAVRAREAAGEGVRAADCLDLYVSYDACRNAENEADAAVDVGVEEPRPDGGKVVGTVDNSYAHPVLSAKAMALASSLALLQGRHRLFFCGSYATPGNGHDLSHLSGLAAASAVLEAINGEASDPLKYYAHRNYADSATARDFVLLRQLMGL